MKKQFLLLGAFLTFGGVFSQTTIYTGNGTLTSARTVTVNPYTLNFAATGGNLFINGSNGNVGINTTAPSEKLEVNGNVRAQTGYFYKSLANGQTFTTYSDRNLKCQILTAGTLTDAASQNKTFNFFDFPTSNYNANAEVFLNITDRGNKGRLSFNAEQGAGGMFRLFDKTEGLNLKVNDDGSGNMFMELPKATSRIVIGNTGAYLPTHKFVVAGGSAMIEGNILTNANVGIGTAVFTDGADTFRLSVDGNIRAKRVKVYTTWADYVFEKSYDLPTLDEVEQHIQQNGHLKDIPSAKEVAANGIELGEMNKLLLQKVEELTLYVIDLNKQVKSLESKLNEQKDEK